MSGSNCTEEKGELIFQLVIINFISLTFVAGLVYKWHNKNKTIHSRENVPHTQTQTQTQPPPYSV